MSRPRYRGCGSWVADGEGSVSAVLARLYLAAFDAGLTGELHPACSVADLVVALRAVGAEDLAAQFEAVQS